MTTHDNAAPQPGWRPIPHELPVPGVPHERNEAEQAPTGDTDPAETGNPFTPCRCNCLCASLSWDPRTQCGCCGKECGRCEHDE